MAFVLCYAGVMRAIAGVWSTNPLYSYGFAVPIISGYVLFARRDELRALRPCPDYWFGIPSMILGLAMLLVGHLGSIDAAQQLSLVVTLAGVVLLTFGRQVLRAVAFPLLYLVLGIPSWDRLIHGLQAPSQVLSGKIALQMLHAVGVPAFREGTTLALPNVTLDILRECSGVNQLIAVFAMSVPAAYLWLSGTFRRAALVAFAVTVAYLSNGFRIALVGFLEYRHLANGDIRGLHLLEGLATSILGYSLILACLSLLSTKKPAAAERIDATPSSPQAPSAPTWRSGGARHTWVDVAALGTALMVGAFITTYRPVHVAPSQALGTLPTHFGSWRLAPAHVNGSGYRLAIADDELDRTYQRSSGERLRLYIGYQRYETQGKELTNAESLQLTEAASPVEIAVGAGTLRLNEVVRDSGASRKGQLFWFDVNGRVVASWYLAKTYTVWTALTRNRTNGAIVLLEWDAPTEADFEASRREVIGFVQLLRPYLADYIPS